MSMQDSISDMLTRIRNGQLSNKIYLFVKFSKFKVSILEVLKKEGYIEKYEILNEIKIFLKYFNGKPVIENIKKISKPSLRVYRNKNNLPKVISGLGISIISTSKGVLTDLEAKKLGVGGEIICIVY
ncbi:30S ribosomal protein S8 [Buchnera aphidicola (Ceratoglyphina bambusae)]|uniref:30S ribosomal protein S8 n=1 Tax=Buchnera aphidicola TaxID=9 RepID=UPI0031B88ECE